MYVVKHYYCVFITYIQYLNEICAFWLYITGMDFEKYVRTAIPGLFELDVQIILKWDEGYNRTEIAQQLGVTRKTVYNRRKKIKKLYGDVTQKWGRNTLSI